MKKQTFFFLHPCPSNRIKHRLAKVTNIGMQQGIGILAQMAKDKGHDVRVLTYNELGSLNKSIKKKINYVFITTYTNQLPLILDSLSLFAEKIPNSKIVIGGVHATYSPESFRDAPYHVLVRGEGEMFMKNLLNESDYSSMKGVFKKGDEIKYDFAPRVEDLDTLPFALRYLKSSICGYRLDVLGHRGCKYACSYCVNCSYKSIYGHQLRYRSPENVISEIVQAKKERYYRHVMFLDENFIVNNEWLGQFLGMYREKVKMRFSIKIRPSLVTEEALNMLENSGCMSLQMGIEAGDYKIRKMLLYRNETDEQIIEAFQRAKKHGFKTYSYNMIGLPDDTEESVQKLIYLNKQACPDVIDYSLYNPYPGTILCDYCKKKNINYPMTDSNLRWEIEDLNSLPDLPGISRERLAYYLVNFTRLIQKG